MSGIKKWGCVGIIFSPFILVGLGTFFFSLYLMFRALQAKTWLPTPAVVEKIDMKISDNDESTTYEATLNYAYFIDGKKYIGNKIGFGYGLNNIEDNQELFDSLKTARKIMIFVNPSHHNESIVIPGLNDTIIGILIFSFMWNSLLAVFLGPAFLKKEEAENPLFIMDTSTE